MSTIHKIFMFCLFTIILIPIHALAELKMGIVNLDLLFKEIPIYRESQEKIKKHHLKFVEKKQNIQKMMSFFAIDTQNQVSYGCYLIKINHWLI